MIELAIKEIATKTIENTAKDLLIKAMDVAEIKGMKSTEVIEVLKELKSQLSEVPLDQASELKQMLPQHLQELLSWNQSDGKLSEIIEAWSTGTESFSDRPKLERETLVEKETLNIEPPLNDVTEIGYTEGFEPFVGENYGVDGQPKILQIGDSHYCADIKDAHPGMTKEIIQDLCDPSSPHEGYKNTYTKAERAISGRFDSDVSDRQEFYSNTAFYNYVQEPMSGARTAPTKEQFERSAGKFFEVLEKLQPDQAIVWGKRLYENMPSAQCLERPPIVVNGKVFERCAYQLKDGKIVEVLCLPHPSTAFSPVEMNKVYKEFTKACSEGH